MSWLAGGASALAAVVLVGFDRPMPRAMPLFARSDAPRPLLGMVSGGDAGGPTKLVRLDPLRLRRLPGRSVVVGSVVRGPTRPTVHS